MTSRRWRSKARAATRALAGALCGLSAMSAAIISGETSASAQPDTSGAVAQLYSITELAGTGNVNFDWSEISPSGTWAIGWSSVGSSEVQINGDTTSSPYGAFPSGFTASDAVVGDSAGDTFDGAVNDSGEVAGSVEQSDGKQPAVVEDGKLDVLDAGSIAAGASGSFYSITAGGTAIGQIGWTDAQGNGHTAVVASSGGSLQVLCQSPAACNVGDYDASMGVPILLPANTGIPSDTTSCSPYRAAAENQAGTIAGYSATDCGADLWSASSGLVILDNVMGNQQWTMVRAQGIANNGDIVGTGYNTRNIPALFLAVPWVEPQISSIDPASGSYLGSTPFTITGEGFEVTPGATQISFGDDGPAADVTCSSSSTCTGLTPGLSNSAQTQVTVSTAVGDSNSVNYQFINAPEVSGISPDAGPITGNEAIDIQGGAFTGATEVDFHFDGQDAVVPVAEGDVADDNDIDITTPDISNMMDPGQTSVVADVTVTTPVGTSPIRPSDGFTFGSPSVTEVSPSAGVITGGNVVTVSGSGFSQDMIVYVDDQNGDDQYGTVVSVSADGTSAQVQMPDFSAFLNGATGVTTDVIVQTNGGVSPTVPEDQYIYAPAVVTMVSPNSGFITGGQTVTITGFGFTGSTAVQFVDGACDGDGKSVSVPAAAFASSSDTQIVLTTPDLTPDLTYVNTATNSCPSNGLPTDVEVVTPLGNTPAAASDQYLQQIPEVTSVTPGAGPAGGGYPVQIDGSGFTGGGFNDVNTVTFTDACGDFYQSPNVVVNNDSTITATVPNGAPDFQNCGEGQTKVPVDVTVSLPDSNDGDQPVNSLVQPSDQFAYNGTPAIASLTDQTTQMSSGPILAQDPWAISGANLTGVTQLALSLPSSPGTALTTVAVTPSDDNDISLTAPNMQAFENDVTPGSNGLLVDVTAQLPDPSNPGGFISSNPLPFTFTIPTVTGINDVSSQDGNKGSILGGEVLDIQGSGFTVPSGGYAEVDLYLNGTEIDSFVGNQVNAPSDSLITINTPDLAGYSTTTLGDGGAGLVLDVEVVIHNGQDQQLTSSVTPSDQFWAEAPATTGTIDLVNSSAPDGPILGGDPLYVNGTGFFIPNGDHLTVSFVLNGQIVAKDDTLDSPSDVVVGSSLTLNSPDLASLIAKVNPQGELPLDVLVTVTNPNCSENCSATSAITTAVFTEDAPLVTSIGDEQNNGTNFRIHCGRGHAPDQRSGLCHPVRRERVRPVLRGFDDRQDRPDYVEQRRQRRRDRHHRTEPDLPRGRRAGRPVRLGHGRGGEPAGCAGQLCRHLARNGR